MPPDTPSRPLDGRSAVADHADSVVRNAMEGQSALRHRSHPGTCRRGAGSTASVRAATADPWGPSTAALSLRRRPGAEGGRDLNRELPQAFEIARQIFEVGVVQSGARHLNPGLQTLGIANPLL